MIVRETEAGDKSNEDGICNNISKSRRGVDSVDRQKQIVLETTA